MKPQSHREPTKTQSFTLLRSQVEMMKAHARRVFPHECCGLIGGNENEANTIYPTRNISPQPEKAYEAAPEDLFAAQKCMRERAEELIAIYHSHPNASDAAPSPTDVRLAFYPNAIYLILALSETANDAQEIVIGGFRLFETTNDWRAIPITIIEDAV